MIFITEAVLACKRMLKLARMPRAEREYGEGCGERGGPAYPPHTVLFTSWGTFFAPRKRLKKRADHDLKREPDGVKTEQRKLINTYGKPRRKTERKVSSNTLLKATARTSKVMLPSRRRANLEKNLFARKIITMTFKRNRNDALFPLESVSNQ